MIGNDSDADGAADPERSGGDAAALPVARSDGDGAHASSLAEGDSLVAEGGRTRPGGPASEGPARPARRWHWHWGLPIPKFLRRGATVIVLILVLEYLVIPKLTVVFSHNSLHRLEHVNALLILLAFACEVVSLFAYAKLTVVVLPPNSLSLSKAWRINLASLTVSHVIPAGTAGGTALSIRLMTSEGLSVADVGFATAMEGIGSAVLLNVMLWLAIVISIPFNGFKTAYVTVAIVSVLVLGLFAFIVAGFASGDAWAARLLRRLAGRFPFIPKEKLERTVAHIAERLVVVAKNPELIRRGIAWAAANWLLDAACLYVCLWALGSPINPVDLIVAYGVGNVLAAIPVTPGGLGVTEFFVIGLLVSFGVPGSTALLAVIGWRFFNFWLPIPVGAICYMTLRSERGASLRERGTVLSTMTKVARSAPVPEDPKEGGGRSQRAGPDPKAGPAVPPIG